MSNRDASSHQDPEIVDAEFEVQKTSHDALSAIEAMTRAEMESAVDIAKRYPRHLKRVSDEIKTMATLDQETAQECFYALPRGGKSIVGPSVRLAEIAVSAMGNIRAGAKILGETEDGKQVAAVGICHDLEKNVLIMMESRRRITDKRGGKFNDDMIAVTANAAAAIGFRNAALKVVPRALVMPAYRAALEVARGSARSITERRHGAISALQSLSGILTEERILAAVDRSRVDELTDDDLTVLRGAYTAIKDGVQDVEDAFPEPSGDAIPVANDASVDAVRDGIGDQGDGGEAAEAVREAATPGEAPEDGGEPERSTKKGKGGLFS